ncbi:hypothetical protein Fmac_025537 [Flemingia macrophylla]|uniref:glucan endo-1,3-beta-D-glucosidase n=1 Tax=Flemingia macrophylla TaxID=520843 RepID=A0ABD1LSK2_9FABA
MISAFAPPPYLLPPSGYVVVPTTPPSWVYVSPHAAPPPFHGGKRSVHGPKQHHQVPMKNVHASLSKQNPNAAIKVSSPLELSVLQSSFPTSSGSFKSELIEPVIKLMLEFLRQTDSHLMLNAYPFFAYAANGDKISLDYALLRDNPDVVDSDKDLKYSNLFNAQIDAIFVAMSALEYDNVLVTVFDTG